MNGLGDLGRDWPTGINIVHFDVERVQFLLWKHFIPSLSQRKHFVTNFLVDLRWGFFYLLLKYICFYLMVIAYLFEDSTKNIHY